MQASRRTISILISSFFSSSSRICFRYLSFSIKHCEYCVCASSREWKACGGRQARGHFGVSPSPNQSGPGLHIISS